MAYLKRNNIITNNKATEGRQGFLCIFVRLFSTKGVYHILSPKILNELKNK